MRIVRYQKNKHLNQINALLEEYDWEPWDSDSYGKYYFCVFDNDELILFGGMYLYDVKVFGRLGLVIGKKTASKEQRQLSFDLLFDKLFSVCEKNKVKSIEYASTNPHIINRLEKKYGFVKHTNSNADMLLKNFNGFNSEYLYE